VKENLVVKLKVPTLPIKLIKLPHDQLAQDPLLLFWDNNPSKTPCFKLYAHFLPKENFATMHKFVAKLSLTPPYENKIYIK
jgi:hypothetical protein